MDLSILVQKTLMSGIAHISTSTTESLEAGPQDRSRDDMSQNHQGKARRNIFMKRLVVTILLIVSLLNVATAKSVPVSNAEALAATADDFFRTWLLRRSVNGAMRYILANPILGTCMTPDYLDEKKVLSRADVLGVFRKAFTHTLKKIPKARTLSDLIDSSGGIPSEDSNVVFARHRMEQNFQIFTMKPVEDPTNIA